MVSEGLLPRSQDLASCPYPEPDQSSCISKIHFYSTLPSIPGFSKWTSFHQVSPPNPCIHFSLSLSLHSCYMPRPPYSSWWGHRNNIWWEAPIMHLLSLQHLYIPNIFCGRTAFTFPIPLRTFLFFWYGGCNRIPCVSQLLLSCETFGRQPNSDDRWGDTLGGLVTGRVSSCLRLLLNFCQVNSLEQ